MDCGLICKNLKNVKEENCCHLLIDSLNHLEICKDCGGTETFLKWYLMNLRKSVLSIEYKEKINKNLMTKKNYFFSQIDIQDKLSFYNLSRGRKFVLGKMSEYVRLLSFKPWSYSDKVTPLYLAKNGFEKIIKYVAKCVYCDLKLEVWEDEDLLKVHQELNPDCEFLKNPDKVITEPIPFSELLIHRLNIFLSNNFSLQFSPFLLEVVSQVFKLFNTEENLYLNEKQIWKKIKLDFKPILNFSISEKILESIEVNDNKNAFCSECFFLLHEKNLTKFIFKHVINNFGCKQAHSQLLVYIENLKKSTLCKEYTEHLLGSEKHKTNSLEGFLVSGFFYSVLDYSDPLSLFRLLTDDSIISTKNHNFEKYRLLTFKSWDHSSEISPLLLANQGFIKISDETAQCVFCNLKLKDWIEDRYVIYIHKKRSPSCEIFSKNNSNIPILEEELFFHRLNTFCSYNFTCYSPNKLKYMFACGYYLFENKDYIFLTEEESSQIVAEILLNKKIISSLEYKKKQMIISENNERNQELIRIKKEISENNKTLAELKEDEEILEENWKCAICMNNTRNQLFFPCLHLICCNCCTEQITYCPFCRTMISGSVDVDLLALDKDKF